MAKDELVLYEVPQLDADLEIDFLEDASLEKIEDGIRKIQVTSDLLALVQGVAIVRIEREELWRQAGYETLRGYRIDQLKRLGMPKQTLSDRRKVAEGFLDHRKLLGKTALAGNVMKLRLLSDALRVHADKKEVMTHFKSDSFRDFREWVKPAAPRVELPDVDLTIKDGRLMLDGEGLMAFSSDIPAEEKDFVGKVLRAAYRARRGACLAHVVPVYDEGEARAVDAFLKKYRASK